MTITSLLPNGEQQFVDANGKPYALGLVYMYVPNTTTFKTTWQDQAHNAQNTNPITLDASGRGVIWGTGAYRQVLKDLNGNTIWDQEVTAEHDSEYDQAIWISGVLGNGTVIWNFNPPRNLSLAGNLTDSTFAINTAPTGNLSLNFKKNLVSFGNVTFHTDKSYSKSGFGSVTSFTEQVDNLQISGPNPADATGGDIAICLVWDVPQS